MRLMLLLCVIVIYNIEFIVVFIKNIFKLFKFKYLNLNSK